MLPRILLSLLIICSFEGLYAQIDQEFWFAAPEATNGHGDSPIAIRVSTFSQQAVVTLTQPANPAFTPIVINVGANTTSSIDLTAFLNQIETKPENTVLNYGLLLKSTTNITAYYEVITSCDCNPEIFALKGKNGLGTTFYTPFQNFWSNGSYSPEAISGFIVIAKEDNTQITITPSQPAVGHPANTPFNITLNKGEVYSVIAASTADNQHMAGSLITSNKPIAVTVKDDSVANGSCRDLMGDQLIPINVIGKEYIAIKGFLNANEKVFVLATENNTEIFIDGNATPAATLQAGQTWNFTINNPSAYINANKNVYVLQASGYGCELGESILPPILCTGSSQVGFTRSSASPFSLNIITKDANKNNFSLNGSTTLIPGSAFNPVPGTNGLWVAAQVTLSTNDFAVNAVGLLTNSSGLFHMGLINGNFSTGCRYGYFSDYGGLSLGSDISVCPGDNAVLDAGPGYDSYLWNNGDTSQSIPALNEGEYWVTVTLDGCVTTDTVQLSNYPAPEISLNQDTALCSPNQTVVLNAGDGFNSYLWNTGASSQSITVGPGSYFVTVTNDFDCSSASTDSVLVSISAPVANFTSVPDSIGLVGQTYQFTDASLSGVGQIISWSWSFGDGDSATFQNPQHVYSETGLYGVTLTITTSAGCESTYSDSVLVIEKLVFPNVMTPNGDGKNDLLVFTSLEQFPGSKLYIYNRWGNLIYESNSYQNNWNGENFPAGTYYYILKVNNDLKTIQKGVLTLIK